MSGARLVKAFASSVATSGAARHLSDRAAGRPRAQASEQHLPGFAPEPSAESVPLLTAPDAPAFKAGCSLAGCVYPSLARGGKRTRVVLSEPEPTAVTSSTDHANSSLVLLLFADYEEFARRMAAFHATLPFDPAAKSLDTLPAREARR
jgi:hypothetical protein